MLRKALASAAIWRNKKVSKFSDHIKQDVKLMAKLNPPRPSFYPLAQSPHADLAAMAPLIVKHSSCPVCLDIKDKLPEEEWNDITQIPLGTSRHEAAPKSRCRPEHVCPDCGWPTHCSPDHYQEDLENHKLVCGTMRHWIEDEHDSKSGRKHWEMSFPGRQNIEAALNFTSWPYLFTTRKFPRALLQHPTAQRHVSKFLTYPYTVAAMLHQPWLYHNTDPKNPIVTESGWHVMSALSHAISVATKSASKLMLRMKSRKGAITFTSEPTAPTMNNDPFRIFIVGPKMECRLPAFVWEQLSLTFPGVPFRLYFIGPDAQPPVLPVTTNDAPLTSRPSIVPSTRIHRRPITSATSEEDATQSIHSMIVPVTVNLRMEYIAAPYETVHEALGPFQRNRDIFVMFNSGVGHPSTRAMWKPAMEKILESRCLTIMTSLNELDQKADVEAIENDWSGKFEWAMKPTSNPFASLRPDIPVDCVHDPEYWVNSNWGVLGLLGIGKEVNHPKPDFQVAPKSTGWFSS